MPSSNPDLTPSLKLPSPTPSDPPDIPGDIKALADRIESTMGYLIDTAPGSFVNNWQGPGTAVRAQRSGALVALTLVFTRENLAMNADQDYTVFTLAAKYRPNVDVYAPLIVNSAYQPVGRFTIEASGNIVARSTVSAAVGVQIQGTVVYAAPLA